MLEMQKKKYCKSEGESSNGMTDRECVCIRASKLREKGGNA